MKSVGTLFAVIGILVSAVGLAVITLTDTNSSGLSKDVICVAGVQYDVSTDSLTGKRYLTVQTTEDFELILCEGN